ncbi:hypothetical protein SARC_01444 [Sphaeroforma arctica JP610]|uniref:glutaminase n=1 Tax=Sphaeroforma arctica JP610 TaxID=667725 RepID=A0A0L0GBW0_9EUKA|nr:hypothetical protein SARC_01444 [Sphaeroforma arctica JP610]KNC86394.1 hypothetical protein SARC_01444 [Sphaeroforma arctica JP610]|eukprot:XP_014160296.1 hypothetical protein SARC_01444 [Sphaeroforma arctica JP610]
MKNIHSLTIDPLTGSSFKTSGKYNLHILTKYQFNRQTINMCQSVDITIGVLALQGAFREHVLAIEQSAGVKAVALRTREDFEQNKIDGLIIPGGESTTMAHIANRSGVMDILREFVASGKPVWGTCAGLIFLADKAQSAKIGGQALIGGLHVTVDRNHFGAQVHSFEVDISVPVLGEKPFHGVFIRAPAILETGEGVEILAKHIDQNGKEVVVAARQGSLLGCSFHPELTPDNRFHNLFVDMVAASL